MMAIMTETLKHVLKLCQTKFLYNKIIVFDSIYFEKKVVYVCVCRCRYVEAYHSNTMYNNVTFCITCHDYSLQPFYTV